MTEKKRTLEVNKSIGGAIRGHYKDAQTKRPLAWQTLSPNPLIEIGYAAGIQPAFPENYACVCAARHTSARYCEIAESHGYSQDICSYTRTNLGFMLSEDDNPPLGGLPEPDLLLLTTNACVHYFKWWSLLGSILHKPLIMVDVPRIMDEPEDYYVDYVKGELTRAVAGIEGTLGVKIDWDKLVEVVALSDELIGCWHEILQAQKAVPAPANLSDLSNILFLMVAMPGTREAVEIMRQAYIEIEGRVTEKTGVVEDEKHRLLYLNIPIWYDLELINYFQERGSVFPISDYTHYTWGTKRMDASRPLESLAQKALYGELNESVDRQIDAILKDIGEYGIDGVVIHSNRSCKVLSVGLLDAANIIRETCKIPVLILDADHTDERVYSEMTVRSRIDTFLEILG